MNSGQTKGDLTAHLSPGRVCVRRERFLQLAGDLVDRGVHLVLTDPDGTGKRFVECLVECLLDGGVAADYEEPGLVSCELLSRLKELLAGKSPAPRTTQG